ncbi:MAG: acyl transferase [Cyclobacteriaceae bacterium]
MQLENSIIKLIPKINDKNFKRYALEIFKFQALENQVYSSYLKHLNLKIESVQEIDQIPFLPIDFYKEHTIKSGSWNEDLIFKSSGTSGQQRSHQFVHSLSDYHWITATIFESVYGPLSDFVIAALLPSYLEQGDSSLISMVDHFIGKTNDDLSGYVEIDAKGILEKYRQSQDHGRKFLLIGVSYALMDLTASPISIPNALLMETGGMKGRGKELTRRELHAIYKKAFGVKCVHSEYGMSELNSQAYSVHDGIFLKPPWMHIKIRDINDPFTYKLQGQSGALNIIDLANLHTCSFLETKDLGRLNADQSFEILGRMDNSDIRGCNLLMA